MLQHAASSAIHLSAANRGLSVHNLGGKVQVQETLAFWDAYVEGDPAAKAYFASDALAHFSQGVARVDRR